jgi:hypothetical protein
MESSEGDLRRWARRSINRVTEHRAALRWTRLLGQAVVSQAAAWFKIDKILETIEGGRRRYEEEDMSLLESLFLPLDISPWISAVPAADHPFQPLSKGELWYQIEGEAAGAYAETFVWPKASVRFNSKFASIKPSDSLVLFGSQVSNVLVRNILGDPWQRPSFEALGERNDWKAQLHWNIYTPQDAPIREIIEYGIPWKSQGHQLIRQVGKPYESYYGQEGQLDDYLLVTRLPRYWRDPNKKAMVIIFAGLHGAGTRASQELLLRPPINELQKVHKKVGSTPFYQALFYVKCVTNDLGEVWPKKITFVDARPIDNIEGKY